MEKPACRAPQCPAGVLGLPAHIPAQTPRAGNTEDRAPWPGNPICTHKTGTEQFIRPGNRAPVPGAGKFPFRRPASGSVCKGDPCWCNFNMPVICDPLKTTMPEASGGGPHSPPTPAACCFPPLRAPVSAVWPGVFLRQTDLEARRVEPQVWPAFVIPQVGCCRARGWVCWPAGGAVTPELKDRLGSRNAGLGQLAGAANGCGGGPHPPEEGRLSGRCRLSERFPSSRTLPTRDGDKSDQPPHLRLQERELGGGESGSPLAGAAPPAQPAHHWVLSGGARGLGEASGCGRGAGL